MRKVFARAVMFIVLIGGLMFADPLASHAAGSAPDPQFDHIYYADTYPDLKAAFGYDRTALWNHYVIFGRKEGRKCYPGDPNGKAVAGASRPLNASEYAKTMLDQVNAYRASKGVEPLQLSQKCLDVANVRVVELSTYFSHTRPNRTSFGSTYEELGYTGAYVCENCAKLDDVEGGLADSIPVAMGVFAGSRRHNAAMLDATYNYVGFGFYQGPDGSVYVTQEFSND